MVRSNIRCCNCNSYGFLLPGVQSNSIAAELIVPFMAGGYILVALIMIAFNIDKLARVLSLIFRSAFGADAVFGGLLGLAIDWGVKRGIYSNEAGQGTGPQAAADAEVSHPAKQGLVQAFSVYVVTLFVCSATAFMILITGMYNVTNSAGGFIVENLKGVATGPAYTQKAVETMFPSFGGPFVAIALFFFAFTSLMAYYYYPESNIAYLFKNESARKMMIQIARIVLLASTYYGAVKTADLAWGLGDVGVGVMAWLNIIAILILQKPAIKVLKDYENQKAKGIDPIFDLVKLGIKNTDLWTVFNKRNYKA